MSGPPGTGKSMLAARFPGILPAMTQEEALESAAMQSLGGAFELSRWKTRPYRSPHHTASAVALVGGGVKQNDICDSGVISATAGVINCDYDMQSRGNVRLHGIK